MNSSWQNVMVDDSNTRVYVSAPDTTKHVSGVIVVHGQNGADDFLEVMRQADYSPSGLLFVMALVRVSISAASTSRPILRSRAAYFLR